MKDLSKITNVLLFKDGYYWLTIELLNVAPRQMEKVYAIIPDDWELKNGFEFASDAYSYIAHLQSGVKI